LPTVFAVTSGSISEVEGRSNPSVIQHGHDGYRRSEYEGNRHIQDAFEVNSVEQLTRHQAMLARLIAAAAPASREAVHV
jgi:hypothetical protein